MNIETRRAALRMAAKVAVLATVGCSGGQHAAAPPSNNDPAAAAPQACEPYLKGLKQVEKTELPAGDPLRDKADIYGPVFADLVARAATQTHACCAVELKTTQSAYRWQCCSALDNKPPAGAEQSACIPWGPPVPPEMPAIG